MITHRVVTTDVAMGRSLMEEGWVGGVEKWRLKLTSAKVEVEVEAELGKKKFLFYI